MNGGQMSETAYFADGPMFGRWIKIQAGMLYINVVNPGEQSNRLARAYDASDEPEMLLPLIRYRRTTEVHKEENTPEAVVFEMDVPK